MIELSGKMGDMFRMSPIVRDTIANGGTVDDCVVALVKHEAVLIERIMLLESIAPRVIRMPSGEKMIYRCPDELVPEIKT